MGVKRDYGSFSSAATRHLAPKIEHLGYRPVQNNVFRRGRSEWTEGFFLQQSVWGSGNFQVTIGIALPTLDGFLQIPEAQRATAFVIDRTLRPNGIDFGTYYFKASNRRELEASIEDVVTGLCRAESWFAGFRSLSDVADVYAQSNRRGIVYAFLLMEARRRDEAIACFKDLERELSSPRYINPVYGNVVDPSTPGAKRIDPVAPTDKIFTLIRDALRKLQS